MYVRSCWWGRDSIPPPYGPLIRRTVGRFPPHLSRRRQIRCCYGPYIVAKADPRLSIEARRVIAQRAFQQGSGLHEIALPAKGFAAEETRAAVARVGELRHARRLAETFLREAELGGHATEARGSSTQPIR